MNRKLIKCDRMIMTLVRELSGGLHQIRGII